MMQGEPNQNYFRFYFLNLKLFFFLNLVFNVEVLWDLIVAWLDISILM